jgi:hypothetical protein
MDTGLTRIPDIIKAGAYLHSDSDTSDAIFVVDFLSSGQSYQYEAVRLGPYTKQNEWIYMEFITDVPADAALQDEVRIYFWNPSRDETVHVDNFSAECLWLNREVFQGERKAGPVKDVVAVRTVYQDMEAGTGWANPHTLTHELALFGKRSCRIDRQHPFSISLQVPVAGYIDSQGRIRVSGYVYSTVKKPVTALVVDFRNKTGSYRYVPYYMNGRSRFLDWEFIDCVVDLPKGVKPDDQVWIYFWNSSSEEVFYIDQLQIDFITTKPSI